MKGMSTLVESVLLILIAVAASVFISGWLSSTTARQTSGIQNTTQEQLQCQYADLYIRDAAYDCGGTCAAGTAHTMNITVVNSGKRSLVIDTIFVTNTTGSVIPLLINQTTLNVGDVVSLVNASASDCSGVNNSVDYVRVGSINCPTAYDNYEGSRIVYTNC